MDGSTQRLRPDPARARAFGLSWEAYAVLAAVGLVVLGGAVWALMGPGGAAPEPLAGVADDEHEDDDHAHASPSDAVGEGDDPAPAIAGEPSGVDTVFTPPPPSDTPLVTNETEVLATCRAATDLVDCTLEHLQVVLSEHGSERAFWMLENLTKQDATIDQQSHTLAHLLGRHALHAHGTITETLGTCSYRVFQGCFHGALQEFFEETGALEPEVIRNLCPPGTPFERYSCVHGLGHGLTLVVHYSMNAALGLCDHLNTSHDRSSCYGGVFMENVVAYMGSKAGGHVHDGMHNHTYAVDPLDYRVPCSRVDAKYQHDCWLMQTSLILYLNGGNFYATANVCRELEEPLDNTCYRSYGRDASAWKARDAQAVAALCAYAEDDAGRAACIRGYTAEVVLNYADPATGVAKCKQLPQQDRIPCYQETGGQGVSMIGRDAMAPVCAEADLLEEENACRRAAGLTVLDA